MSNSDQQLEFLTCEHMSVSRRQTWEECPAKYKFRYHLKVVSDEPIQPYFTYGKLVHKIAEVYVQEQGKVSIENITSDCLSGKIEIEKNEPPPVLDGEYKKKLPSHVKNIKEFTDRIGYDGYLEWPFRYDLDPPNELNLVGFIDRLVVRKDQYFIIDYKTTKKGKWRKNRSNIHKDLQLRCYAKVVQKEFGAKAENIRAALFYLDGADLISTRFTEDSIASAEEELRATFKQIIKTPPNSVQGNVGDHCRRCDYRNICPFFSPF